MAPSRRTWTRYLAWVAWGLTIASAAVAIAIRVVSRAPIPENRFQLGEPGVVQRAMQPASSSVWLRAAREPAGRA